MATKNDWADIDDAGYWHKPEAEDDDSKKTVVTDEDIKPEPKPALVKLSEGQFIEPGMGYEYNKRFKVKVKVDFLDESARNMKKVNFSLYTNYMNKTESLSHNVDGYEDNGYAEADMTLYYSPSYDEDKDKNVKYFFKATHERGDKVLDSEKLSMPQETHFVELKKDDYDESGAQKYNKSQEGDTFKANNVVKELQGNLITMGFLETGTDDGYFGDGTDAAIREFQDYAIKSDRMKRKVGKIEKAEKVLDQKASDGIVGKKTADEIDTWLRKDWVKPIPVYRKGEYDDKGVSNGKGAKGTDDHHTGTPIVAAQEDLQKVGLYQEFLIDGWFHDHMYEAVKQFQEAAQDGKFLINDVLTDIGEKLTGHRQGILCPKTQKFLKAVVEKKEKVPRELSSDKGFNEFAKAVGDRESSDNYKAENQCGYLGRYQFGMARIMDLSEMVERKGNTKGFANDQFQWKSGYSKDKFLNDSKLQDDLFKKHALLYANNFKKNYSDYIGKNIKLDFSYFSKYAKTNISEVKISISGLVGGAHIAGPGAIKDFLKDGEDKKDENGTPISEYVFLFTDYNLDK